MAPPPPTPPPSASGDPPERRPAMCFQPRSYQTQVFEAAKRRNTIAVLETGAGKTFIAVMLIREFGMRARQRGEKPLMVFLAPTVHLVNQQFGVIRDHTEFNVMEYYGAKGVDDWSAECWEKEIGAQEIMVMTPQILLDALRHSFLNLSMICLLIFDECHRASGNHPYIKIMKEFYQTSIQKPSIFGMTASPVARKGVSSVKDSEEQMSKLESILDSKVCIVEDRAELETLAPSPKEINTYYDANKFHFEELKIKFEIYRLKIDASLVSLSSNQFQDTIDIIEATRTSLSRSNMKILYCLETLGLICACEATKICIEDACSKKATGECDLSRASSGLYVSFLEDILRMIEETSHHSWEEAIKTRSGYLQGINMGFISPKLDKLVQIFQSFGSSKEVLCLIFVERIIAARVIERFMKKLHTLSQFSISYLTGGNSSRDALTPHMQRTRMDMFRSGKVNLLVTTDVAEEGIHVPNCSWVIRFDLPITLRSYVQSRGRARRHDSHYVLMLERGNTEQREKLFAIILSEHTVKHTTLYRDTEPTACLSEMCTSNEIHLYRVESTGASVTSNSSVNLIYKYCEKLPKDRYFNPKPMFHTILFDGSYECTLSLPPNAAFPKIVGPLCGNSTLAKQLVCLEACKKLHQLGALNNNLLPILEVKLESNWTNVDGEYSPGAGTTKRKELHGMTSVLALSGTWAHKPSTVILNAYKLSFICDKKDDNYSAFVLLVGGELDGDVGCAEFELFLIPNKLVKCSVSPRGKVELDKDEVEKSKLFQEFLFNGTFGRLFTGTGSTEKRKFLFREGHKISWTSTNMYLLLPFDSSVSNDQDAVGIHWKVVNECASVVNYLRSIYSLDCEYPYGSSSSSSSPHLTDSERSYVFHLANKSLHVHCLKESVVLAIHTGRIYSVVDVMNDITPESPFDELCDAKSPTFISFIDYYLQKYSIVLQHPAQPVLLLKQSHNPHNLFSKFMFEDGLTGKSMMLEKEQVHAHIPPELLVHIDISIEILKSYYLLPSVMHRLESLMLASQFREEVGCCSDSFHIPSFLILEAITTLRCCEIFSLERLELLGDSVLKYAVGCHLFLKYTKNHEGLLSDQRTRAVCNLNLHKLGIGRSLQGYIRDSAFDPRRWVAPGQISLRPVPCNCGVNTSDVPLERAYISEDTSIVVGKPCDEGHRWMCSKTIADCVEALIGAYYVAGGLKASLSLMKWFGIDATFETLLVAEAKRNASLWCYLPKYNNLETLESKLGYRFLIKGLLLEAVTHPSQQELGIVYCYQRLEFLGDSVLDLLITRHLFMSHNDIDPGELTDLRSALVSNENFAQAAVKHNFLEHLQHNSGVLLEQVTEYVKRTLEHQDNDGFFQSQSLPKAPKVLGDMVESIAAAILIDADLNLDKVWEVFEPLLSPIVTPDKLSLPPLRELIELCSFHGYFIGTKCSNNLEEVAVELSVQLKDELLVGHGHDRNKKAAKAQAALCLLQDLKKRSILHARCISRKKQCEESKDRSSAYCLHSVSEVNIVDHQNNNEITGIDGSEKQKIVDGLLPSETSADQFMVGNSGLDDHTKGRDNSKINKPVIIPLKREKGGPRIALFKLCEISQWPMPKFEWKEEMSRSPIIVDGMTTTHFNSFTSSITLHIPNVTVITAVGEPRTDKSSSQDSASLAMLLELEKRGQCFIQES